MEAEKQNQIKQALVIRVLEKLSLRDALVIVEGKVFEEINGSFSDLSEEEKENLYKELFEEE